LERDFLLNPEVAKNNYFWGLQSLLPLSAAKYCQAEGRFNERSLTCKQCDHMILVKVDQFQQSCQKVDSLGHPGSFGQK